MQTTYEKVKAELRKIAKEIREAEKDKDFLEAEEAQNLAELRLDSPDYSFSHLSDWQ